MPNLRTKLIVGGKLRNYLKNECGLRGDEQLIIYAGSYQSYACLDNIVKASQSFDENRKLVLMMYGIPDHLKSLSKNCIVVPPVHGEDFYEWLLDADCALLPYESKDDFNVQNCSPQKIFDCYCVGVPYVASNRPLIKKCLAPYPDAGIVCDFTNIDDIKIKIEALLSNQLNRRITMQALHKERFNYGLLRNEIINLIRLASEK
jgi:glycosyltransferase involved in cell wall biosynthesis